MQLLIKLGLGTAVVTAALALTPIGRYIGVWIDRGDEIVDNAVPTKTKIAALKNDLKGLDKPINEHKNAVATRRVEAARATAAHTEAEEAITKLKRELKSIKQSIETGSSGEAAEKKTKFAATFARLEQAEARAEATEKAQARADEVKRTAEKQLDELLQTRDALATEIADLETQYADVQLTEARARTGGDSEVAALKARVADLKLKLEVRQARADMDTPKQTAPAESKDFNKAMKEYKARTGE